MSWNRREFSVGMGAVAAMPLMPGGDALSLRPSSRLDMVIHELEVASSKVFADRCASEGAIVFSTAEDVGELWHQELRRRIAEGACLGGLTRHASSFLLATLARDAGFRVSQAEAGDGAAPLVAWRINRA